MSSPLPPDLAAIHTRLQIDLPFFLERAPLIIKDKSGALVPLVLNRAQRHIHACLEKQTQKTGRVRACLLKGRQQGGSTYVAARFYWKMTRRRGISVFILSHEGKTTDKLFKMAKRYHDYVNVALRPEEGASNRNQLSFPKIEADYSVGTAGNENVGRGGTAQLFHGSEAAYWEHDYEIQDGALESIGEAPGTEIILESTANGPKGLFYQKCMDALHGRGDYELIFIPWFWQDEYERDYAGEEITEEEDSYSKAYLGESPRAVALRKIIWRRAKIIDLCTGQNQASGEAKFRQIYPSNPIEAFQSSGVGLVRPDAILAARKSLLIDGVAPIVGGVDPAGDSDVSDRTIIALRKGRHLLKVVKFARMRPMELAGILIQMLKTENVRIFFVDRGYGEGTIDRCRELGFGRQVQGVAFNERPMNPDVYLNKRSEMLIEAATWLNGGGVRIPDDDEIHADFACVPIDESTSNGLKFLKPKREIKKVLGRSTDIFDAVGLTFAYPVQGEEAMGAGAGGALFRKAKTGGGLISAWMRKRRA